MSTAPVALKVFTGVILMFLFTVSLAAMLMNPLVGIVGIVVTTGSLVLLISLDKDQP